jgi:nucleoside-triphosphatase THEP1
VVLRALESGKKVLGTIMLQPHPFADQVKHYPQVKLVQVSRMNHDLVLNELLDWIKPKTNENNS